MPEPRDALPEKIVDRTARVGVIGHRQSLEGAKALGLRRGA